MSFSYRPSYIPQEESQLIEWCEKTIKACMVSQKERVTNCSYYQQYYYMSSGDGTTALYPRCFSHVDRKSAYLFAPSDVHFQISFDEPAKEILEQGEVSAKFLSYEFHRTGMAECFATAVDWALVKGSSFVKTIWGHSGLEGTVVQQENMGVFREDINGLDRQECFVHQIYVTQGQFERIISGHPEEKSILSKIRSAQGTRVEDTQEPNANHQVIIGGINPITNNALKGQNVGSSGVFGGPMPQISPSVRESLICINEIWTLDEERNDYTTIQYVNPGIVLEGKHRRRNLCGIEGEHPFTQVSANMTSGYFWGWSDLAQLVLLQDMLNERMFDLNRALKLKLRPPRLMIGDSGITDQRYQAAMTPNGFLSTSSPSAKIESLTPDIPQELFESIGEILSFFDDVGGWEAITKGQGEAGVRSGVHADTLVRTATPRLRDAALVLERQCGDLADFCFKILQAKLPRTFKTYSGQEFMLGQLPDGLKVSVNSHSSSPAFTQENKQLAIELLKAGSIDAEDFIKLTHPPNEDILVEKIKEKEKLAAEEQKMAFEEAKKNPNLMEKLVSSMFGKKKK